jgi:D-beta-D-heptose 7-phosphate kinase/D-beta-D-heptose 1-phosphate adenosyltransferase
MFFKKLSLVTGGFDPIHSGHIAYFERAKDLSDYLVVGINTDIWLTAKKGQYFQSWVERAEIIRHLDMVDAVITVPDNDKGSACGAIAKCLEIAETVVFCNGGDRGKSNTPETDKYGKDPRVQFEYSIGGNDKKNSSSWILRGYFERQRKLLGI